MHFPVFKRFYPSKKREYITKVEKKVIFMPSGDLIESWFNIEGYFLTSFLKDTLCITLDEARERIKKWLAYPDDIVLAKYFMSRKLTPEQTMFLAEKWDKEADRLSTLMG